MLNLHNMRREMAQRTVCYRFRLVSSSLCDFFVLLASNAVQGLCLDRSSMSCSVEKITNLFDLMNYCTTCCTEKKKPMGMQKMRNKQRTETHISYVNSFTFKCFGHQNENIIEWKLMTGNLFHSNKNRLVTCDFFFFFGLNGVMAHQKWSSTESSSITFLWVDRLVGRSTALC